MDIMVQPDHRAGIEKSDGNQTKPQAAWLRCGMRSPGLLISAHGYLSGVQMVCLSTDW